MASDRDGFILKDVETGQEVEFVACDKDHPHERERVEYGLVSRCEGRFIVADTRAGDGGGA